MPEPATPMKGFSDVDAMPDPALLVAGMDATAQWPAVRTLRQWERDRLAVSPGDAVLDVGCGAGDVIIELAAIVGGDGRAVGVDYSEQMLAAATHTWLSWDPDSEPMPQGFIPLRLVAGELAAQGLLSADVADEVVGALEDAARRDRFFMALTMFAAGGVVP